MALDWNRIIAISDNGSVDSFGIERIILVTGEKGDKGPKGDKGDPGGEWGYITGDIERQLDLREALAAKANAADLGDMASLDSIDYESNYLTNKPTLGELADHDTVDYETEVTNTPTLGDLAAKDSVDYSSNEVTNKPTLGDLSSLDSIDYTSNKLTNKPTLGSLADQDTVDYDTEVTNKPTLGDLASKDTVDYATEVTNKPTLGALAAKDSVDYSSNEVTNKPTLGTMAAVNDASSNAKAYGRKDGDWYDLDGRYYTESEMDTELNAIDERLDEIEKELGSYRRYGVTGIGRSGSALSRIYDAVGMVAEVGTDDASTPVTNDFDNAGPWMWKKCVGSWSLDSDTGRAKFTVNAYLGDDDFAEDGSMGDYVAVEIPVIYRYRDETTKAVSLHHYEGWEPYSIFQRNHDPNDLVDKLYMPCYSLALKDGHAVSLPGYDPEQNHYQGLMNACRTYGDGSSLGNLPILPWAEWFSFIEDMFQIEFATQNCQAIMAGASNLRSENADLATFVDATHILLNNYNEGRVVGEYIAIIGSNVDRNSASYKASHRITGITRCDSSGNPSASGSYSLITIEDLGRNYYTYDLTGATQYRCAARPYRNGACASVVTPSGSPINNTNGYYPMRYRYIENIYGNQYKTACDLFDVRIGTGDADYSLEWYLCKSPETYVPSSSSKPDATDLAAEPFVKLGVTTSHDNYVSGYIVSKQYDSVYKDVWIPKKTTGGSATTYYCDYAYLVNSNVVRACRFGGIVYYGSSAGLSNLHANYAPSSSSASSGGSLCFAQ